MQINRTTTTSINLDSIKSAASALPKNQAAELLANAGDLMKTLGGMIGSKSNQNVSQQQAISKLFGGDVFEAEKEKQQNAAKSAAAGGGKAGGAMSLGALLAMIGGILVKSIEGTMDKLKAAAEQLDAKSQSGGPTAADNQKIQELTFNLQQIQQTLNRVNETVTNLSRSQSDAQKSVTQNLSV